MALDIIARDAFGAREREEPPVNLSTGGSKGRVKKLVCYLVCASYVELPASELAETSRHPGQVRLMMRSSAVKAAGGCSD